MSEVKIPKVIHYCWFGGGQIPAANQKCIRSWKKYCPDYEIVRWDESNFDIHANCYAEEAHQCGKWAFVSDYARLKIIYDHGGIYLDTDVELLKPLDPLLEFEGFMGFQNDALVSSGLGFGAVAHHPVIGRLLADYDAIHFRLEDGTLDMTACPDRNATALSELGVRADGSRQECCGIQFFPAEYFSPKDWRSGKCAITANSYSIHHYKASWMSSKQHRNLRLMHLQNRLKKHERLYHFLRSTKHKLIKKKKNP